MRITSGRVRNHQLKVPEVDVRPATDRVREAVFSMLGPWIAGKRVLDLYAGTGAYGLEALSRGASQACFVEHDRKTATVLQANIDHCKFGPQEALLRIQSVESYLDSGKNNGAADLVFADPPYQESDDGELLQKTLQVLESKAMVTADGFVLYEQRKGGTPPVMDQWEVVRDRTYGRSQILLYRRKG